VVESLMRLVGRFVLRSAEQRRTEGRLEFHDLLVRARDLLRDHPEVRRQLAARHRRLLVDEFQDTDPLQLDIVSLIAARDDTVSAEWDELPIDGGRVFFVGDPKQSIYRFRRADMRLYTDARSHYGDGLCELSANFRTVPGIIDWVNHAFGQLIVEGDGQPAYLPLEAVRPPLGDDVAPVTVLGGAITGASANEIRSRSATELVTVLREMVESGRCLKAGDTTRPMTFGDVVVLVPSRIPVPALEDAFEAADVPYRLETSSLIWASQEIREVMSVLRAVDDPGDQISIVAALRTPMLGCSDDDLVAWRTSGGRWSYLSLPEAADATDDDAGEGLAVASALRTLRSLHDERWWLGPDGLIERLATHHATFQLALLAGRRRDRWRRLRFLADQARSFVESQRCDLASFVAWAELQSSDIVRVSSPTLPEGDEQAVRVMTIHASKGLEFPVVALFGLGVSARRNSRVSVVWAPTGPEVRFSTRGGTEGHDALVPAEEQMDRHERMRLLYVAATRAMDRLILCTHHKAQVKAFDPATAPFGHLVEEHLPEDRDDLWTRWTPTAAAPDVPGALGVPTPAPADSSEVAAEAAARDRFVEERGALLAAERRAVWSATAVARAAVPEALDTEGEVDEQPDDERSWRRGRAGTAIGRAVHGTLQLVDFDDPSDLDAIARSQSAAEGVDDAVDTVAALARAGVDAPLIRELVSRRHWREMYVAAPIGDSVVEGYVDLLADDGDGGLVVLDYKTDTVRDEVAVKERTERYRLQAATYALAVEAVTGVAVTRSWFLFLGSSGAIESSVDDLDVAKAEARAVLDATA
jgi:ATP-dependent helicase/nuclease subunit A